ncbi:MAG: hypothetical protein NT051_05460 [Candidatus Micrarchaeota archaeon]|nr:hypothetical protein [Candidatus Micrarchaeota archaeon]
MFVYQMTSNAFGPKPSYVVIDNSSLPNEQTKVTIVDISQVKKPKDFNNALANYQETLKSQTSTRKVKQAAYQEVIDAAGGTKSPAISSFTTNSPLQAGITGTGKDTKYVFNYSLGAKISPEQLDQMKEITVLTSTGERVPLVGQLPSKEKYDQQYLAINNKTGKAYVVTFNEYCQINKAAQNKDFKFPKGIIDRATGIDITVGFNPQKPTATTAAAYPLTQAGLTMLVKDTNVNQSSLSPVIVNIATTQSSPANKQGQTITR